MELEDDEQTVAVVSLQVPEVLVVDVGQQGWPACPHPQAPLVQVPYAPAEVWHICPSATQRPARQQPLLSQLEPSQHGSPGPPHTLQTEL